MVSVLKSNEYSAGIRRLPEEKLRDYIVSPDDYHDEAVIAAIWELSNRRKLLSDEQELLSLISERLESKHTQIAEIDSVQKIGSADSIPNLYTFRTIQIFSILFSVFAGGVLMAINFNRTTQRIEALKVLGFSAAYTLLSSMLITLIKVQPLISSLLFSLLGAYLIHEFFWKRVLGNEFRFNKQQIWTAVIIALILVSPIIWYAYKTGLTQTF